MSKVKWERANHPATGYDISYPMSEDFKISLVCSWSDGTWRIYCASLNLKMDLLATNEDDAKRESLEVVRNRLQTMLDEITE